MICHEPIRPGLDTSGIRILLRGGGDIASGVAWRLHRCGFRVAITEIAEPLAVRRAVSFCEAVYDGRAEVEGVTAALARRAAEARDLWNRDLIPLFIDPGCEIKSELRPHVLVDAILAKRNVGTTIRDAPLVIALGPGFAAGLDCHCVVETNRGHRLGRLLTAGSAEPNTGVPGPVLGMTHERVMRAPTNGRWETTLAIGEAVQQGEAVGMVGGEAVLAAIDGVLRGLIRPGTRVRRGLKIGDIDPRGRRDYCFSISEKALAIAGGVIEGILLSHSRG